VITERLSRARPIKEKTDGRLHFVATRVWTV